MKRLLTPIFALFAGMAALAIGARPRQAAPPGNLKMTVTPITFPEKYLQADKLTPKQLGLNKVVYGYAVLTGIGAGAVNIANVIYSPANETLKLYDETPAEVANEAEVKKPTALVFAFGS